MSNISSVNNLNTNLFKKSSLSKADAGTAELLSNVFKSKNLYDYQSHDGDTLSLSSTGKEKQVMEDLMSHDANNSASGQRNTGSGRPE